MHIVLSWFGESSRCAAKALQDTLPLILPTPVRLWMSDTMQHASPWFTQLMRTSVVAVLGSSALEGLHFTQLSSRYGHGERLRD